MKKILTLLLLIQSAFGQNKSELSCLSAIFDGKINENLGFTLKINAKSTIVTGTYFYTTIKTKIPVTGTLVGNKLTLTEKNKDKVTGLWECSVTYDNSALPQLKGNWFSPDLSKKFKVEAEGIEYNSVENVTYTNGLTSIKYKKQLVCSQDNVTDENSYMNYFNSCKDFIILEGMTTKINENINGQDYLSQIAQPCIVPEVRGKSEFGGADYNKNIIVFAKGNVLTIYSSSYYEGGAHPSSFSIHNTYNLKTGNEVFLADILKPDGYIGLNKLIKQVSNQPDECKESGECYLLEKDVLKDFSFGIVNNELVFNDPCNYPHVAQFCTQDFAFPLSKIKDLLNPNSIVFDLVK